MSGLNYYKVGERQDFGTHTFTAQEIIAFGKKFDPQPFHVDEARARDSMFGGLCASGWHTGAVWMRKICEFREKDFARVAENGGVPPVLGPSPGIRNMRWLKPVFAGETIRFGCVVAKTRVLRTKPGWGLVETHNFAETLDGKTVMAFDSAVLVKI
ncbi:MaoC family dehydratase [Pararhizobium haloflavum]|uniref:MaoC family dehydratase n=1 Tax=Pararhizobium haloflavum TaxID=2037914 RepID=UPI000C1A0F28|nr:MaoC family dehydratase [Pararhizobium haloflavum]